MPFLSQKAFVLKTFATSKLWYLAQILPITNTTIKALEAKVGEFMWRGKWERLALTELFNSPKTGGLGLPNIGAKCDALFLKHMFRILSLECGTRNHLLYWIGEDLGNLFPRLPAYCNEDNRAEYFKHCLSLLKDFALDTDSIDQSLNLKTSEIYDIFNSTPPPPKIITKFALDWERVWVRLEAPIISCEARDLCFMVIHDIYPNRLRKKATNQLHNATEKSTKCLHCLHDKTSQIPRNARIDVEYDNQEIMAQIAEETNVHIFCECPIVKPIFEYFANLLVKNKVATISNIVRQKEKCIMFDLDVNVKTEQLYLFLVSNLILYVHKAKKQESSYKCNNFLTFLKCNKPDTLSMIF